MPRSPFVVLAVGKEKGRRHLIVPLVGKHERSDTAVHRIEPSMDTPGLPHNGPHYTPGDARNETYDAQRLT